MQSKLLSLVALAAAVSGQSLTSVLGNNTELSNLTTFVGALPQISSALSSAQNITILAPSNAAFARLLNSSAGAAISANDTSAIQALLMYHVLNGTYNASAISSTAAFIPTMLSDSTYSNVTGGQVVQAVSQGDNVVFFSGLLQNSTVTQADITFTGGVIHVIDNVLTLPQNISTTAVAAGLSAAAGALTTANLVNAVDSTPDLTVFVPNNDAFAAIGSAVGNLTVEQLTGILTYHVVNGSVGYSSTLENGTQLTAMNGGQLTITINNGSVFVNSARVVLPDVLVANGVVHVIDNVLNPNATSATPNPTATSQSVAFSGATAVSSNVPFTSGVPVPTSTLGGGAGAGASSASAAATSSSTATGAAYAPLRTGAMGAAALFAAGGAWMNV